MRGGVWEEVRGVAAYGLVRLNSEVESGCAGECVVTSSVVRGGVRVRVVAAYGLARLKSKDELGRTGEYSMSSNEGLEALVVRG